MLVASVLLVSVHAARGEFRRVVRCSNAFSSRSACCAVAGLAVGTPFFSAARLVRISAPVMGANKMIADLSEELISIDKRKSEIVTWQKELPYLDSRKQEIEILLNFMEVRQQQLYAEQQFDKMYEARASIDEISTAANAAPKILLDDLLVVGEAIFQSGAPVSILEDLIKKINRKAALAGRETEVGGLVRRLTVKMQAKIDYPMADRFTTGRMAG